ncbi:Phenolic glucoside malonyltransferase 2 [Spatholobus suberectus]|nr:Phenolic glucoside malonyltransferase 2 [Spatholobus suberectus]
MAQSPTLRVHQVCPISPPQETAPTSLPFTFFDVLWLRFPPVERLFFYPFPTPPPSFFNSVLPNLKRSLSLTLQHFPPLAGTITWPLNSPLPVITYHTGNAVPFTVAESDADFNALSSNLSEVNQRQQLTPHLAISHEQASVLALQVTLFPNHGFCIGITAHHAALDGKSSTLFMKSWAHLCSHLGTSPSLPKHLTPSFDRSTIRDPSGIGEAYANSWLSFGGDTGNRSLNVWESLGGATQCEVVKGLFELTPSDIKRLKKHAESEVVDKRVRATSFSVACAYVLACAVKVDRPKTDRVAFVFSVDCRSRLEPPVSGTYFGNCVVPQLVVVARDEVLGSDGFVKGLEGISDALNGLESGVLNGAENWMSKIQGVMGDRLFSIAGSPRFEVYGVDFGWGRPRKVDVTSVDKTGAFSLAESRDLSGGIEIALALNKGQMEAFSALFNQGLESLE